MNKVKALVGLQVKSLIRQPIVLVVFLLLPVCFSLLFKYALEPLFEFEPHVEPFEVAVVDLDQSFETKAMINQLSSSSEFRQLVTFIYVDEEAALTLVKEDQVASMVIIPPNFSADLRIGQNTPIEVIGNPQRPLQAQLFLAVMESAANLITAAQSAVNTVYVFLKPEVHPVILNREVQQAIIDFSLQSLARKQIFATTLLSGTGTFLLEEYYFAASIVLLTFISGLFIVTIVRNDFSEPMLKRLKIYGFSKSVKVAANFFTLLIIITIQISLFFAMAGSDVTGKWLVLLGTLLVVACATSAFYTFIASFSLRPFAELVLVGTIIFIFAVIGGCVLPISFYPDWVGNLGQYSPFYAIREAILYSGFIYESRKLVTSLLVICVYIFMFLRGAVANEARKLR